MYPNDGAITGVRLGRFVESPAVIELGQIRGIPQEIPIELQDVLGQIALCDVLYASAALGSRADLREALQIDPALAGVDLLYAEDVLDGMMQAQREKLPRFFAADDDEGKPDD